MSSTPAPTIYQHGPDGAVSDTTATEWQSYREHAGHGVTGLERRPVRFRLAAAIARALAPQRRCQVCQRPGAVYCSLEHQAQDAV